MNEKIKDILLEDISKQKRIPTKDDLKGDRPCALYYYKDEWAIEGAVGSDMDLSRLKMFSDILKHFKPQHPVKFLMFFDDYTKDVENTDATALCFAKHAGQNFVTIPNIHILCGFLDSLFKEVDNGDISFDKKHNVSFFASGPNCNFTDPRARYTFKNYDPNEHVVLVTNHPSLRVPIQLQLQAKYLVNIDGHGLCYDRLYWQMRSNSVPVYIEPNVNIKQIPDVLFKPDVNYIKSDISSWHDTYKFLNTEKGQEKCAEILQNNFTQMNDLFPTTTQEWSLETLKFILDNLPEDKGA